MGRQFASVSAWILVVRPPRDRPMALFFSPFAAAGRAVRLHRRGVDENLRRRAAGLSERVKQVDPDALGRPADIAIVERFFGPYSGGASIQRPPDLSTWTMPLMTRRSSTRALPRVSVGRCGAIFENCASVSQN